jgi:hypothetical protein
MTEAVLDARGVEITEGATVVVAGASRRLYERVVKRLERPGTPDFWVNVRFENGGYTSPDRCAVVEIARLRDALVYLADPESWQGNPDDHAAVLLGHFTPYELARETLGLERSE